MPGIDSRSLSKIDLLFSAGVFSSFLLYFGLTVFRSNWGYDFGFYLSAVSALQTDMWNPAHETVAGATLADSLMYSPYIFLVAVVGKLASLSAFASLQLAGCLNLVLYVLAIIHFFRVFSVNRQCWSAPALFLVVSLLVRRFNYSWSSETSLLTLPYIQSYPSTFAWPIVLLALAETELYLRNGRSRHLLAVLAGFWCIALSHMLTASWLLGLLALRILFRPLIPPEQNLGSSGKFAAGMVLASGATLLWPYLDVLRIFDRAGYPENPPFGQHLASEMWYPFLLGLPALVYFLKRKRHRLLALWFAGTWLAFFVARLLGLAFGNRFIFFQLFFLHVVIAEALALGLKRAIKHGFKPTGLSLVTLVCLFSLGTLASPQLREATFGYNKLARPIQLYRLPSNRETLYRKWSPFRTYIRPEEVVLTPLDDAPAYLATYTGCRCLLGLYPIAGSVQRKAEVARFMSPGVPWAEKRKTLVKYGVGKVLVKTTRPALLRQLHNHLGPPIFSTQDYLLFKGEDYRTTSRT